MSFCRIPGSETTFKKFTETRSQFSAHPKFRIQHLKFPKHPGTAALRLSGRHLIKVYRKQFTVFSELIPPCQNRKTPTTNNSNNTNRGNTLSKTVLSQSHRGHREGVHRSSPQQRNRWGRSGHPKYELTEGNKGNKESETLVFLLRLRSLSFLL